MDFSDQKTGDGEEKRALRSSCRGWGWCDLRLFLALQEAGVPQRHQLGWAKWIDRVTDQRKLKVAARHHWCVRYKKTCYSCNHWSQAESKLKVVTWERFVVKGSVQFITHCLDYRAKSLNWYIRPQLISASLASCHVNWACGWCFTQPLISITVSKLLGLAEHNSSAASVAGVARAHFSWAEQLPDLC